MDVSFSFEFGVEWILIQLSRVRVGIGAENLPHEDL